MKLTNLKWTLFGVFAILSISVLMTSCEQDAVTLEQENIEGLNEADFEILNKTLSNYEIVEIDNEELWNSAKAQLGGDIILSMKDAVDINSSLKDLSFKLNTFQVNANDFKIILIGEGGVETEVNAPEMHALAGTHQNGTGNILIGITPNDFRAEIVDDQGSYVIEPLKDYVQNAKVNQYLKYQTKDVNSDDHICGVDFNQQIEDSNGEGLGLNSRSNDIVEISALGDYALYSKFTSASNAYNWMYWRMTYGGYRYFQYTGFPVEFRIKTYYLYTWNYTVSNDITSPNGFLIDWLNYLRNNTWFNYGDANILFTGKDVHGVVGNAFANTICQSILYGSNGPACFVEWQPSTWRSNNTTAHEVGHIIGHGVGHAFSGFMISDASQMSFAQSSKNLISAHLANNSACLN